MNTNRFSQHVLAVFCCAAGLWAGPAWAEKGFAGDRSEQAIGARMSELEAEMAALRQQMNGGIGGVGDCACGAPYPPGGDCGGCCDCCDPCCWNGPGFPCGWYAGGEFIMMKPHWKGFDAFQTSVGSFSATTVAHEYDYDETFRFWAGYTGCSGLGVRASWWKLDHDSDAVNFTVPATGQLVSNFGTFLGAGETFSASQSLELQTIDLEATKCYDACGGTIVVAFGLRFVEFDVQTREQSRDVTGTLERVGEFGDSFDGVGPTLSLDFVCPLGFCGWSLYANLRGTVAFGEEKENARLQRFDVALPPNVGSRTADETLSITELQLALQYCRGCWFARGGWQAQYWDDVESDQPTQFGNFGSNIRSDLGLQGFFIAAGATF
jgi:hypothetical protein